MIPVVVQWVVAAVMLGVVGYLFVFIPLRACFPGREQQVLERELIAGAQLYKVDPAFAIELGYRPTNDSYVSGDIERKFEREYQACLVREDLFGRQ